MGARGWNGVGSLVALPLRRGRASQEGGEKKEVVVLRD